MFFLEIISKISSLVLQLPSISIFGRHSSLTNFDLEDYYDKGERVVYDIKQNLFNGFVLKEKQQDKFILKKRTFF